MYSIVFLTRYHSSLEGDEDKKDMRLFSLVFFWMGYSPQFVVLYMSWTPVLLR